jgi:Subtilisin inhibitor-like
VEGPRGDIANDTELAPHLKRSPEYPVSMRIAVGLALAAVVLAACSTGSAGPVSPAQTASLTITFWPDGANEAVKTRWTLRCGPAGGTLPRAARACTRLLAGGTRLFVRTSGGVACTQIYGGPQTARIVGTLKGRRVFASFSRQDGCAISRWDRVSPWLIPAGGVTS